MLDNLIICIPTYKRKWLSILPLIRQNQDLIFHLFVRKDDFDKGYYYEKKP